jgi:hypothetical protein
LPQSNRIRAGDWARGEERVHLGDEQLHVAEGHVGRDRLIRSVVVMRSDR